MELTPGENVLLVTAQGEAGRVRTELRRVHNTPRKPQSDDERAAYEETLAELQEELESRALEARLAKEAAGHRGRMRREIDVRVEPSDRQASPR